APGGRRRTRHESPGPVLALEDRVLEVVDHRPLLAVASEEADGAARVAGAAGRRLEDLEAEPFGTLRPIADRVGRDFLARPRVMRLEKVVALAGRERRVARAHARFGRRRGVASFDDWPAALAEAPLRAAGTRRGCGRAGAGAHAAPSRARMSRSLRSC